MSPATKPWWSSRTIRAALVILAVVAWEAWRMARTGADVSASEVVEVCLLALGAAGCIRGRVVSGGERLTARRRDGDCAEDRET